MVNKDKVYLNHILIWIILSFALPNLILYIKDLVLTKLKTKLNKSMNSQIFSHLLKLPYKFFETRNKTSILYSLDSIATIRDGFTNNIVKGLLDIGSIIFTIYYIALHSIVISSFAILLVLINIILIFAARKVTEQNTKELLLNERTVQSV